MNKIKSLSFIIIFFIAAGSLFASGGKRNGSAGATELLIPVGARGIVATDPTQSAGVPAGFAEARAEDGFFALRLNNHG